MSKKIKHFFKPQTLLSLSSKKIKNFFEPQTLSNKKGFLAEALVDFYSYITFILIIMIFFLLFSVQKCTGPSEQEMIGSFEGNNAEIILLNYLRTPVKIDSQEMSMTDLIRLWHYDQDKYYSILKKRTEDILTTLERRHQNYNPGSTNQVISGYKIIINDEHQKDCNSKTYIGILCVLNCKPASFESKNYFTGSLLVRDAKGCTNLGTIQIPISTDQSFYLVLSESQKDISKAK